MIADDYVRRVEQALRDLPWSTRRDLIADLRNHLAELPEGADRVARFGTPENYAAELRAAAGLERRHGFIAYVRARRPRNLILVTALTVVLLLAIGFTIGLVVYVDGYQPICFCGGASTVPPGTREIPGISGEEVVDAHWGRPFLLGEEITNNGRFAVRVLGVPYSPTVPWSAHLLMARVNSKAGPYLGPLTPFHPFDLQPGERRYLMLKGVFSCRYTHWQKLNNGMTYSELPVRYSFLWRTATTSIPLSESLAVHFVEDCPYGR